MDIQFIQFNDALPLSSVEHVPGFSPPSIKIAGLDFTSAVEVRVNSLRSPSFVVVDRNHILAQLPVGAINQAIHTLQVLSANFTATAQSIVTFRIGPSSRKVSGTRMLIQHFLKMLLTTPNCDSFAGSFGGGVLELLGANANSASGSNLVTYLTRGVSRTAEQLRTIQARQVGLANDERLLAANLLGVAYNAASTGIEARIELLSMAGTTALANFAT